MYRTAEAPAAAARPERDGRLPSPAGASRTPEELIDRYHGTLVRPVARRLAASLPASVDVDELEQIGLIEVWKALGRYRPERGARFETFASKAVRGAMVDFLRRQDHASRRQRELQKIRGKATEAFRKREGRRPDDDELRRELERIAPEDAGAAMTARVPEVHRETAAPGDEHQPIVDLMVDAKSPPPGHDALVEDLKRWITQGLNRRDRLMVLLYYSEQLTMAEVAVVLDLSESRVSQEMKRVRKLVRRRAAEVMP